MCKLLFARDYPIKLERAGTVSGNCRSGRCCGNRLRINALRFPLIYLVAVDPILAIFALFLLAALLEFFPLLATVAHDSSSIQCKARARCFSSQPPLGAVVAAVHTVRPAHGIRGRRAMARAAIRKGTGV